jgi:ribonucleoside-diphosphate reductase alpha chain
VIESTNPCGEQPLLPYESCNLGSINLSNMVKNHKVDYDHLEDVVYAAVHFLDNVIDVNKYPSRKIEFMTKRNRKIGLGVMGFADMLVKMQIAYNSIEARELAENIMSFIQRKARAASMELAKERGMFPNWRNSIYDITGENGKYDMKLRNAALTTIAPTGTISTIAGCWGGIEPFFSIAYVKKVMDGTELREVNPHLKTMLKRRGFLSDSLINKIAEQGSLAKIDEVPEYIKEIFVTSHEMSYVAHIKMQAAFQRYCDNAVSKTINFNNDATEEQIRESYLLAFDSGLKGITVFRDGCKSEQVYYQGNSVSGKEKSGENKTRSVEKLNTPEFAIGTRIRKETGCGKLYVHVYRDEDGNEIEVFADLGKGGGCPSAFTEGVGRMSSLALKHGASIEEVRDELLGIKCPNEKGFGRYYVASCIDGMGKAIHDYIVLKKQSMKSEQEDKGDEPKAKQEVMPFAQIGACPECGGVLDYVEGCRGGKCRNPACTYFTCS